MSKSKLKVLPSGNIQFLCESEFLKWVEYLEQDNSERGV